MRGRVRERENTDANVTVVKQFVSRSLPVPLCV